MDGHVKRHMEDGAGGIGGGATSSLAALLREGVPKEPLPLTLAEKSLIEAKQLQQQHQQTLAMPGSPEVKPEAGLPPPSLSDVLRTNPSPIRVSSASPSTTASSPVMSPFAGLPMGFASPFASLMRSPIPLTSVTTSNVAAAAAVAQAGLGLLPPGLAPFFPPGMIIPGLTAAAGIPGLRAPMPAPTYDPMRHPLTRMPDAPEFRKRGRDTMMSSPLFSDDSEAAKKARLNQSMRMLKDEPVPDGYMRFRFNEDCGFTSCNYREHQTHFHCMRKDCNYRFCDKTRFVQHTARHERLDTLCGQEFEGFRGVSCSREACEFNIVNSRGKKDI